MTFNHNEALSTQVPSRFVRPRNPRELTTGGPLGNGGSFAYMGHFNHDWQRSTAKTRGPVYMFLSTRLYTKGYP